MDKPLFLINKKTVWPRHIRFDNILNDKFTHQGYMNIPIENARSIPRIGKNYMTEFSLFKNFGSDGDNFSFKSMFYNTHFGKENYCYTADFEIIGTKSSVKCVLTQPGCKVYGAYKFSEVEKNGMQNKIEGFEYDFSSSKLLKVENHNKQVVMSVDGKVFCKKKYIHPIGNIVGLKLTFKGSASVDYVELSDLKSKRVYQENFD